MFCRNFQVNHVHTCILPTLCTIIPRYQSNTAKQCLDEIVNIQPKDSSGGGGETREAVVSRQAADMLEKLPSGYIPHEVLEKNDGFHV